MKLWQHFENFKLGNLVSVDLNNKHLTFDGRDGIYSYTLHTGEYFWNDGNCIEDIEGVTIHNLKTDESLVLCPYPDRVPDSYNYVDLILWTDWIKNLDVQATLRRKETPVSVWDQIENI